MAKKKVTNKPTKKVGVKPMMNKSMAGAAKKMMGGFKSFIGA